MRNFRYYILFLFFLGTTSTEVLAQGGAERERGQIQFAENKGQRVERVLFDADIPSGKIFLESDRWTFHFKEYLDTHGHEGEHHHHHDLRPTGKGHAYQMVFHNANEGIRLEESCVFPTYRNYYQGKDRERWAGGVQLFEQITYRSLYNGIDLNLYSAGYSIKYDFIVAPGADTDQIAVDFKNAGRVWVEDGKLFIKTSVNEVVEQRPYAYQYIRGKLRVVPCEYQLHKNRLTYSFPKGYNKKHELIIDPELVFSSYTGSTADNWGFTATYDIDRNLYGGGIVFDVGYPTTLGSYDATFNSGDFDIGISKFNQDGSNLLFSTYIGGSDNDTPHSLVVNSQNQLVLLASTGSSNFPTTVGCYDPSFNGGSTVALYPGAPPLVPPTTYASGSDIAVAIFEPDGSALVGSTFFGGNGNDGINKNSNNETEYNYGDHARGEIIVDENDNIYIASSTTSTNLPTNFLSAQNSSGGGQDGCLVKLNSNVTNMLFCSYLGGGNTDAAYGIKLGEDGSIYVCGGTRSTNFPTSTGALNGNYGGGQCDGFVTHISSDGQFFLQSTYIGTGSYDQAYFLEIDDEGYVYLVGQTLGNYPVSADSYSNNNGTQFIHKLDADLNNDPIESFSTIFGSGSNSVNISPTAFLVDQCFRIYVSGWGGSVNQQYNGSTGFTNNLPTTNDAYKSNTDGSDLYFIVFEKKCLYIGLCIFFWGQWRR